MTVKISISLVLGILAGAVLQNHADFAVSYIKPFGTIYLNLIKMIVVPVVMLSIAQGIISLQDIRKVGSIGSMYPQKVFKGKKMAGRMGHDRVTVKNLVVSYIDSDHNLIGLKGAVPGPNKGLVMVEGKD